MFKSAGNHTFRAQVGEILATVAMWWFSMLLAVSFFKFTGLATIDLSNNIPILGVSANYLLHSYNLTLNQALASPFVVMGVLITIIGAPFLEEVIFRGPCKAFADKDGKLKPEFLFLVLGWSFIMFGLAHGNWYFSVMIQGVGGLFLARLWFRNGPSRSASYFSCVAAHSLYNISCVIVVWIWGR